MPPLFFLGVFLWVLNIELCTVGCIKTWRLCKLVCRLLESGSSPKAFIQRDLDRPGRDSKGFVLYCIRTRIIHVNARWLANRNWTNFWGSSAKGKGRKNISDFQWYFVIQPVFLSPILFLLLFNCLISVISAFIRSLYRNFPHVKRSWDACSWSKRHMLFSCASERRNWQLVKWICWREKSVSLYRWYYMLTLLLLQTERQRDILRSNKCD